MLVHSSAAAAAKPWDHGRLKVDPTGRMLVHEDGHPFFWMGDSCWEFMHRSTREEADRYLADRAEKRFNVIQAAAVAEFGAFSVPNAYGHLPFEKTQAHPGGDVGVPRVRPGDNDDYWDHVKYIVDRAAEHGIYVCVVVTWGSHGAPWGVNDPSIDEHNAKALGSFIGGLMKNRPNVIYMLQADRDGEMDGVDYRPLWRLVAQGVKEADPNHLMSILPKNYDARHWFGEENWLDFNMIQYRTPPAEWDPLNLVSAAWTRKPAMPFVNVESHLEDNAHLLSQGGITTADLCRREFYWYVFSGAFGHTYGHLAMITWWDTKHPYDLWFTKPKTSWHEALNSPGAREKKFARNLMESRPLLGRIPDASLIAAKTSDHLEACRGDGYVFIYTPAGRSFLVNRGRISGQEVRAWWFDPRTGAATEIGTFVNRGSHTFDPPGEGKLGNDWILVLDDASRNYPPPGSKDHPQTPQATAQSAATPAASAKPAASGTELLADGDFEDGANAWALNGADLAAGAGVNGGAALAMKQAGWKTAEQRIAIVPGGRYTLSGHVRSDACTAPAGIMVLFTDETGREVARRLVSPAMRGTTAWKRYSVEARAPAAARFLAVRLYSMEGGAGQAFFDQISVVAAEKP